MEVDPKGRIGHGLNIENALLNLLESHHGPGQKSKATRLPGGCNESGISHPPHGGLNDGVSAT